MGSSWSAIRSETESSENRIDWASIESKSVSKLYDPLELSVRLTDDTKSRLRKVGKVGIWKVGFEIDVADMQKRYEICEVHTQLKEDIERLCMTGEMFKSMVDRSGVTIEGICNINALHASLNVGAEEVGICLVVDVCREGLKDCVDIGHLIRRVYGCTNGGQTIS